MKARDKITILMIIILIIIDQITKIYMINSHGNSVIVIEGILQLSYAKNTGIAFGLADKNLISIIITDMIVIFILLRFLILQRDNINKATRISLILILAGGMSNLIDRIVHKGVIDFIDISQRIEHFPIFNIADIFIIIGFIMFVIVSWNHLMSLRKENRGKGKIDK